MPLTGEHRYAKMRPMKKITIPLLFLFSMLFACDDGSQFQNNYDEDFRSFSGTLEEVISFNPLYGETPESVATDFQGNLYVDLALTGEIVKIDPSGVRSHLAWLPMGNPADCLGPFPAIMGALAIDSVTRDLYVPVNSCDFSAKGIYRVSQNGNVALVGHLPPEVLGNGIALRLGRVYVADAGSGRIWKTEMDGSQTNADVWVDEPLLADPDPTDQIPGANGLQFYDAKMWVTNAGAHSMVSIDLEFPFDGSGEIEPGDATMVFGPLGSGAVYETDVSVFPGCDDFAFDLIGRIYCTTDPFQTVVLLNTFTGAAEVILDGSDGIDGPSAAAFGRGQDRRTLYITSAMFPFPGFISTGFGPSVKKLENVPFGGYPLR